MQEPPLFVFNGSDHVRRPTGSQLGREKLQRKFSRTGKTDPGKLLLKNQFHNSVDC